ncbi:MAG TPA: hypothetical protein VLY85_01675 [Thermoplasmata archaeon]|nr:hypothetical protein [Thermoplasmata archaeon]
MGPTNPDELERSILLHLLVHRGAQVRFEADQSTTEFGVFRAFESMDTTVVKQALRHLEMGRFVYRRVQYVIGYSEPKLVFSLTPSGHRFAQDLEREASGDVDTTALPGASPSRRPNGAPRSLRRATRQ